MLPIVPTMGIGRTVRGTLAVLLICAGAFAQQPAPAAMTLSEVKVEGLHRYTLADVITASGLTIGSRVSLGDIQAAADRLSRSGLAASVAFRYSYRGDVLSVTFEIEEAATDMEVIFDNFPWFSEEELVSAIARDIPGFTGKIANVSEVIDRILQDLEGLLKSRHISGRVSYLPFLDTSNGRSAHLFKVDSSLPICRLTLQPAATTFRDELSRAADGLLRRSYSRTNVATFSRATLVPIYRQHGHLQARFERDRVQLVEALNGCGPGVRVSLIMTEGLQYAWNGATWTGNRVFGVQDLDKLIDLKQGAVADGLKLDRALTAVARAYARNGHIAAHTNVKAVYTDTSRSVQYDVTIEEGPQYRMGTVTFTTGSDAVSRGLGERWEMKTGAVFDADYAAEFLKTVQEKSPQLLQGIKEFKIDVQPKSDTLTVDLSIRLQ